MNFPLYFYPLKWTCKPLITKWNAHKILIFFLPHKALEEDSEADHDPDNNPPDIDEMLDELEDLSDSGPEIDTISVMSTPKPRLRPFFTGRSTTPEVEIPQRPVSTFYWFYVEIGISASNHQACEIAT